MLESLLEPFSYSFMIRSFLISIFVGISLPMIGSFVINRNLGFMGDAIAHASLPVLVIGAILGASVFLSAIPAAIIIAVTLSYIISRSTVGEDTAIGIVFSTFFAVGIILLKRYNLATTLNIEDILFGQILGVSRVDVISTIILSLITISTILIFYKQILYLSFDPIGAQVTGLKTKLYDNLFLVVLSLAVIGALQSVGIILVLSMLITPAAAAKLIMKNFQSAILVSSIFGILASISGLYLSFYLNLPSGPAMALSSTSIFAICWIFRRSVRLI
ncbi:MAG: metal ABC transporter permease [SAR202 cluster bacterium]|nr:metal ABC transporter permease [SAR202 cluster bacterium]|tara:strand:- start:535 stop:1359 length:825 start_codon:yes stop_codon:yes gene_type:complete